jgi:hypothetical protein
MKTAPRLFCLTFCLLLAACQTQPGTEKLDLPAVQKEFNAAKPDYEKIAAQLKDSAIVRLDPSLQPGAWLMRGMSEWELKRYAAANSSAIHGLDSNPRPGSRDEVMLTLLPALVIDSQIDEQWQAAGKTLPMEDYEDVEQDFRTALGLLNRARGAMGELTPQETASYYHYQRWRMLYHWQQIIFSLATSEAEQERITQDVRRFVDGKTLLEAADAEKKALSLDDPYRRRIAEQSL